MSDQDVMTVATDLDWLITHQRQPCPVSCVTTCMAMILNRPVETLMDTHKMYVEECPGTGELLTQLGIPYHEFGTAGSNPCNQPGVWVCAVPSLNIPASLHQILIEVAPDMRWCILDPNRGKDGKKFYTAAETEDSLGVPLQGCYIVEAHITREQIVQCRVCASA